RPFSDFHEDQRQARERKRRELERLQEEQHQADMARAAEEQLFQQQNSKSRRRDDDDHLKMRQAQQAARDAEMSLREPRVHTQAAMQQPPPPGSGAGQPPPPAGRAPDGFGGRPRTTEWCKDFQEPAAA
ncbi:unnamed protein product, partial [Prorocentrum cordatum]